VGIYLGLLQSTREDLPCHADDRAMCAERLRASLVVIERDRPTSSRGFVMEAQMRAIEGDAVGGAALLARRCPQVGDRFDCLAARADLLLVSRQNAEFDGLMVEMSAIPCSSPSECAARASRLGDLFAQRGAWGNALTRYSRAAQAEPTVARWARVADAAGKLGLHGEAAIALEKAIKLDGESKDPSLRVRLAEERRLSMSRLLEP
jgi:tetratricopeptide (TPR) repeat protein